MAVCRISLGMAVFARKARDDLTLAGDLVQSVGGGIFNEDTFEFPLHEVKDIAAKLDGLA